MRSISSHTFFILPILAVVAGCWHGGYLSEDRLRAYPLDPANGLLAVRESKGLKMEVHYQPKDIILNQELTGIRDLAEQSRIRARFDSLDYFVMRLSRDGHEVENSYAGDPASMTGVTGYLGYYLAADLSLVTPADTLEVLDVGYARTFGAAEATQLLLAFRSALDRQTARSVAVVWNDSFFGTGRNVFEFDIDNIKHTPKLKQP